MGSVFISLCSSFGKAQPSVGSLAMIFCSFASFMAEAMIWWIFRTVLALRPFSWCLLSIRSTRPFSSSFL